MKAIISNYFKRLNREYLIYILYKILYKILKTKCGSITFLMNI